MARQQQQPEVQSGGLRALVFLALALIAGAAATVMVINLIQTYNQKIEDAQKPDETVVAIVAAGELYPGLPITEQDIVGITMPKKYVPADAFTAAELVVASVPRERILAGEFIRPGRLADGETGVGLNALIDEGKRAISINISNGAAVSGFLNPGNRVDVLVTITDQESGERKTTSLLQNTVVLAVNNRLLQESDIDPKTGKKRKQVRTVRPSVTLMVTPEEAEKVAYAEKEGEVNLVLRNAVDVVEQDPEVITTHDLLGTEEPKPAPVRKSPVKPVEPKPEEPSIQIIKGTKSTNVKVPQSQ